MVALAIMKHLNKAPKIGTNSRVFFAASEEICVQTTKFRPSMTRNMTFRECKKACNTTWTEFMCIFIQYCHLRLQNCTSKDVTKKIWTI